MLGHEFKIVGFNEIGLAEIVAESLTGRVGETIWIEPWFLEPVSEQRDQNAPEGIRRIRVGAHSQAWEEDCSEFFVSLAARMYSQMNMRGICAESSAQAGMSPVITLALPNKRLKP